MKEIELSRVYRLFYPAVPVVVASSFEETVSAMPVVTAVSVSNVPPRVGFSSLETHATYKVIASCRCFSMSWLHTKFVGQVELLGSKREGVKDKLSSVGLKHHAGRVLEVPVIEEAAATLECSLVEVEDFGDHNFLVGDVKAAYSHPDFSDYWQFKNYKPILYVGSPDKFRTYEP